MITLTLIALWLLSRAAKRRSPQPSALPVIGEALLVVLLVIWRGASAAVR